MAYAEGGGSVYYQDNNGNWFRDNFTDDGLFQATDSLTLSEVRNEEAVHDLDLDGNGVIGDTIESVLANDGQSKGIFKTTSGSYIIDDSTLSVGDQTNDPTILTQEVTARRGPTTIGLKEFDYRPTGIVTNSDGTSGIYYQDTSGNWFRESFSATGVFTTKQPYSLSQLFADESKYKNDLNNDGNIGDVITAVIGDNGSIGLYQTGSGSYLIDNSGLDIGDSSVSPTLLMQAVAARRGPTTMSLYDFSNTPTGTVALTEGGFGVYYRDVSGTWKRDNFDTNGVFKQTDSYSFTELLADESTYNVDLDKDGSVGDVVAETIISNTTKPSSLYKTLSGQYVVDNTGLSVGDSLVDPESLVVHKTSRGKTTETNYKPTYSLTGGIAYEDIGGGALYYQDNKGNWFRDNFLPDGIYHNTESLSLAQVLAHEIQHNVDLNGDTFIGNTVKLVLADDSNVGVYQKVTGEYIIDDPGKLPGDSTNTIYLKKGSKDFTANNQVTGALIEDGEVSLYEGKDTKWNEHTFGYDLVSETGTLSGSQSMTLENVFALEDSENKDLNDDGVIGNAIVSTYNIADEAGDIDWGFYKLASGNYITDDNGLTIGLKPTDNQKTLFKKGTTPHTFTTEPTSALGYTENGGAVYYQASNKNGVTMATG